MIYDNLIIGSGIAGASLAFISSEIYQKKTAIIEKNLIGGEISRYGGAVALVFGDGEKLKVNKITEHYLKNFYNQGAPLFKRNAIIRTSDHEKFPYAKFDNGTLSQSCFVGNPSDLAKWIINIHLKEKIDSFEGIEGKDITSNDRSLLLSTGEKLYSNTIFIATGNHDILVNSTKKKSTDRIFKKLNLVFVDGLNINEDVVNFYHDIDCYDFSMPCFKGRAFCFPTDTYIDYKYMKYTEFNLTENSIKKAESYLKTIYPHQKIKIIGGRTFFEKYTHNRMPNMSADDESTAIINFTSFSGSGLRLSLGYADKVLGGVI